MAPMILTRMIWCGAAVFWACLGSGGISSAAEAQGLKNISPSTLLDQVMWSPGDYSQMCDMMPPSRFGTAPLPVGGTAVPQEFYLSPQAIKTLKSQRDAVVQEIVTRLEAFEWKAAIGKKPVPKKLLFSPLDNEENRGEIDAKHVLSEAQPPRELGSRMLEVVMVLAAKEALPRLLKLEASLREINEAAEAADSYAKEMFRSPKAKPPVAAPAAFVPTVPMGGFAFFTERSALWEAAGDPAKPTPYLAWRDRLHQSRVFEREILGAVLAVIARTHPDHFKALWIGKLHAAGMRRLLAQRAEAQGTGPEDADTESPLWRFTAAVPWSESLRAEVLTALEAALAGRPPQAGPEAGALLAALFEMPGEYSQMCMGSDRFGAVLPLPTSLRLLHRHFDFSPEAELKLSAYRDEFLPLLRKNLAALSLKDPAPASAAPSKSSRTASHQKPSQFGPLLLSSLQILNAVETLPDLLRLEAEAAQLITAADADPKALLPVLPLDSFFSDEPKGETPEEKSRHQARRTLELYQRELLGLMRILLDQEECEAPILTTFQQAIQKRTDEAALENLPDVKTPEDIKTKDLEAVIGWDETKKQAFWFEPRVDSIPFRIEYRTGLREAAEKFLKTVPPGKRKAGLGMPLKALDRDGDGD
jgi:hypothetical protein